MNFNKVNFAGFVTQYMQANAETLVFQSSPVQIYPLSIAPSLIKTPTPLFRAEYNFLLLFLNGGGEQQVDNEILELEPNDVLFIREGHLNAIKSIHPQTEGYFIYIDSTLLPQIFINRALLNRFTFYPKHSVSKYEMEWLCKCCELIFLQDKVTTYDTEICTSLLKAMVMKMAEASPATFFKTDRQSEVTILFKELLYENFIHKRNVKFYADLLSVSENYLNRCVNYVTAKPPKQHINELVIYQSKILLQDYSKDISQVAFELNFSDPSYFGRLFKQVTNQTPTQYRALLMQDSSGYLQD